MGNVKGKKDKTPTYTYIKEFEDFSQGFTELISLIPELGIYANPEDTGYEVVVRNLVTTILENIPSVYADLYPNTLAISVSAKEVGFLTDNALAFGWKMFNNVRKKGPKYIYQFRVTFLNMSLTKRRYVNILTKNGWKERDLSEKQSRFWDNCSYSQRVYGKVDAVEASPEDEPKHIPASSILHEASEDREVENKASMESNNGPKHQSRPKPIDGGDRGTDISSDNMDITRVASSNGDSEKGTKEGMVLKVKSKPKKQQPSPKQPLVLEHKEEETTNTNTVVKFEGDEAEKARMAGRKLCSIQRGANPALFVINHYGKTINVNLNNKVDGIYVDRGSQNIVIEDAVYNYGSFMVNFLEEPPQMEESQFLPNIKGKMLTNVHLDDTAFVGKEAIEKMRSNAGYESDDMPDAPTQTIFTRKSNSSPDTDAPGSIVRKGRNLVIDRRPTVPETPVGTESNGVAVQSIRMRDE